MQLPVLLLALLSGVSADPLLVLSTPSLLHEASPASFSPAGMAQLALDALGVATGRVSSGSAPQSPLQADLFTHADAYALLLLEENAVSAVDAAMSGSSVYHQLFQGKSASVKVPAAAAQELQAKHPGSVRCAGSVALCGSIKALVPEVDAELVQSVLRGNGFLDVANAEDVAFAKQLAQVAQLTATLKQDENEKLYVVGISSLSGEKQQFAAQAAATTAVEFLAQLLKSRAAVGVQVMTGKLPVAVQDVAALSRRARNRRLVTSLNRNKDDEDDDDEDEDDEEDDEDEVEVEDLAVGSGSEWEDENATTTTNSTASPITMPDIAEFQIILWTSVLLGAILVISVLAMGNMNTGRDSLLYAKFIADVNGRKTN